MSCRSSETVERVWVHSPCVQFGSIEHTCRTIECGDTTANTDVNQNSWPPSEENGILFRLWKNTPASSVLTRFQEITKHSDWKKRKTILISQSHRKTTSNNLYLDLNCYKRMYHPFLAGESQYLPVAPMTRKATLTLTMSTWTQRPKLLWGIFCFLRKVWKLLWGIFCFPSESLKAIMRY